LQHALRLPGKLRRPWGRGRRRQAHPRRSAGLRPARRGAKHSDITKRMLCRLSSTATPSAATLRKMPARRRGLGVVHAGNRFVESSSSRGFVASARIISMRRLVAVRQATGAVLGERRHLETLEQLERALPQRARLGARRPAAPADWPTGLTSRGGGNRRRRCPVPKHPAPTGCSGRVRATPARASAGASSRETSLPSSSTLPFVRCSSPVIRLTTVACRRRSDRSAR